MDKSEIQKKLEKASEEVFAGEDVVAAYLYGSVSRGKAHKNSDIDVAVLFEEEPNIKKLSKLALELEDVTGLKNIDLRSLNSQGIVFVSSVIKEGEPLYEGDHDRRVEFEAHQYNRYLDMKPYIERYNRRRAERMNSLENGND